MAKAAALWNLTSQSTKAADAAFDIVGVRFSVPCATRWNSYCSSVKKIISCDEKKLSLQGSGAAAIHSVRFSLLEGVCVRDGTACYFS